MQALNLRPLSKDALLQSYNNHHAKNQIVVIVFIFKYVRAHSALSGCTILPIFSLLQ